MRCIMSNLYRLPTVMNATGLSRATIYLRIKQGLIPTPVKLGGRAVAWPSDEISAINSARIAGKTNIEIQELVIHLEKKRLEIHN